MEKVKRPPVKGGSRYDRPLLRFDKRRIVKTTLYITEGLRRRLKAQAAREGISAGAVLVRALERELAQ